jgi:hypothetical protein
MDEQTGERAKNKYVTGQGEGLKSQRYDTAIKNT